MESTQEQIVYHTRVTRIDIVEKDTFGFTIENVPAIFWVGHRTDLQPGDRVKITITKEPTDAHG